jgi:hypothetical protein
MTKISRGAFSFFIFHFAFHQMTSCTFNHQTITMPLFRNFTYWIDKRKWKYYFLMLALNEGS